MPILVKIYKNSPFLSKFSKNLDFGKKIWKFQFWWKLSKNLDFGQNSRKIWNFSQNFRKSLFSSKFSKSFDLRQNFQNLTSFKICEKSWSSSKFKKTFDFGQNLTISKRFRFWSIFLKISLEVKIISSSWFGSKFSKNLDLDQNFRKSPFSCKFWKSLEFPLKKNEKIELLETVFRKITIFVTISRFWSQFWKKFRIWSILSKTLEIGHNFRKITVLVKIYEKFRLW